MHHAEIILLTGTKVDRPGRRNGATLTKSVALRCTEYYYY